MVLQTWETKDSSTLFKAQQVFHSAITARAEFTKQVEEIFAQHILVSDEIFFPTLSLGISKKTSPSYVPLLL